MSVINFNSDKGGSSFKIHSIKMKKNGAASINVSFSFRKSIHEFLKDKRIAAFFNKDKKNNMKIFLPVIITVFIGLMGLLVNAYINYQERKVQVISDKIKVQQIQYNSVIKDIINLRAVRMSIIMSGCDESRIVLRNKMFQAALPLVRDDISTQFIFNWDIRKKFLLFGKWVFENENVCSDKRITDSTWREKQHNLENAMIEVIKKNQRVLESTQKFLF